MSAFAFLFLDCFIPVGVMGRVLEQIPAVWVPPRMSLQLIAGPYVSTCGFCALLKGTYPSTSRYPISSFYKVNY